VPAGGELCGGAPYSRRGQAWGPQPPPVAPGTELWPAGSRRVVRAGLCQGFGVGRESDCRVSICWTASGLLLALVSCCRLDMKLSPLAAQMGAADERMGETASAARASRQALLKEEKQSSMASKTSA